MKFRNILVSLSFIALLLTLTGCSSTLDVVKAALAKKSAEVYINDIEISEGIKNPSNLLVVLYVSVKNTGDAELLVNPAQFSLATSDGLVGNRHDTYKYDGWDTLRSEHIHSKQRKEGAIFFEIPYSDIYTLTYNKNGSAEFNIPSDIDLFKPLMQNVD
ncbi:DUF4352 domain-containing protein [Mesobacillus harenae]|uniref:DUF4352 domain-containing protein n=1 Tax=Mesobacillus harenae TaxID=2213203 RepID=UPI001580F87F|nr:DUF4352 domain-containing protein [Mesobacillus harenae]